MCARLQAFAITEAEAVVAFGPVLKLLLRSEHGTPRLVTAHVGEHEVMAEIDRIVCHRVKSRGGYASNFETRVLEEISCGWVAFCRRTGPPCQSAGNPDRQ